MQQQPTERLEEYLNNPEVRRRLDIAARAIREIRHALENQSWLAPLVDMDNYEAYKAAYEAAGTDMHESSTAAPDRTAESQARLASVINMADYQARPATAIDQVASRQVQEEAGDEQTSPSAPVIDLADKRAQLQAQAAEITGSETGNGTETMISPIDEQARRLEAARLEIAGIEQPQVSDLLENKASGL